MTLRLRNGYHNQIFRSRRTYHILRGPRLIPRLLHPWCPRHLRRSDLANRLSRTPTRLHHGPRRQVQSNRRFPSPHDPCHSRSRRGLRAQPPSRALDTIRCCSIPRRLHHCLLSAPQLGRTLRDYLAQMGFPLIILLDYRAWLLDSQWLLIYLDTRRTHRLS